MYESCAQIENDTVIRIIMCCNVDWAIRNLGGEWQPVMMSCGIGYTWDGNQFNPPEQEENNEAE